MRRIEFKVMSSFRRLIVAGLAVLLVSSTALAADVFDFSGSYVARQEKSDKSATPSTLRVTQTLDFIEITSTQAGKSITNRLPLNGTEVTYTSSGGVVGTGTVKLKGKYLIVDSNVAIRPAANGPMVHIHTRERWQMSADRNALKIESSTDFPGAPAGVSEAIDASFTETFVRSDQK
jgi:hypothetical protein